MTRPVKVACLPKCPLSSMHPHPQIVHPNEAARGKRLSLVLVRDGISVSQVYRTDSWAVYRMPYKHPMFDVFRIRIRRATVVFGNPVPAHEGYPAASEWGRDAWSVLTWGTVRAILADHGQPCPDLPP